MSWESRKVFVSFAAEDEGFVKELSGVLGQNGKEPWAYLERVRGGEEITSTLRRALKEAEVLLVVVSRNALGSEWILKEAAFFSGSHPDGRIVPLLLDETRPGDLLTDLADIYGIDFSRSQLKGLEELQAVLLEASANGRGVDQRASNRRGGRDRRARERRSEDDRRQGDRRRHTTSQRLRNGFWTAYARETGASVGDGIDCGRVTVFEKIVEVVSTEARSYRFFEKDGSRPAPTRLSVSPEDAVDRVARGVWEDRCNGPERFKRLVHVVEGIAEALWSRYTVESRERRETDRRSGDRREGERRQADRRG